jgi:hypothetical protein
MRGRPPVHIRFACDPSVTSMLLVLVASAGLGCAGNKKAPASAGTAAAITAGTTPGSEPQQEVEAYPLLDASDAPWGRAAVEQGGTALSVSSRRAGRPLDRRLRLVPTLVEGRVVVQCTLYPGGEETVFQPDGGRVSRRAQMDMDLPLLPPRTTRLYDLRDDALWPWGKVVVDEGTLTVMDLAGHARIEASAVPADQPPRPGWLTITYQGKPALSYRILDGSGKPVSPEKPGNP